MKQYLELLQHILQNGKQRGDRTGTGTIGVFGHQMRFDLQEGFPLLTTKKLHFKSIAIELLWFLTGSTNIQMLKDHNVRIWDEWATESGEIGPLYGKQWLKWADHKGREINQIEQVIEMIKKNPYSRRLVVSAWNPADLPDESFSPQMNVQLGRMALAACHAMFQFHVQPMNVHERIEVFCNQFDAKTWTELVKTRIGRMWFDDESDQYKQAWIDDADGILNSYHIPKAKLSCQLYQRSADVFLGVPFNIASYAAQ